MFYHFVFRIEDSKVDIEEGSSHFDMTRATAHDTVVVFREGE